jgi:hypothetical protein
LLPFDFMRFFARGLTLLLSLPALSVELFRYRSAAKDGGTLEYVFAREQNSPDAVTKDKEKAAEIAADFMATFSLAIVSTAGPLSKPVRILCKVNRVRFVRVKGGAVCGAEDFTNR